jgi:hypothetical protein
MTPPTLPTGLYNNQLTTINEGDYKYVMEVADCTGTLNSLFLEENKSNGYFTDEPKKFIEFLANRWKAVSGYSVIIRVKEQETQIRSQCEFIDSAFFESVAVYY